jgi:hypothetical protein
VEGNRKREVNPVQRKRIHVAMSFLKSGEKG